MIYTGATGLAWGEFFGADGQPGTEDELVILQDSDPYVLEQRVNARGESEWQVSSRYLLGIQIAGAGKGKQFTVMMLLSNDGIPTSLSTNAHHFGAGTLNEGLRVFIYGGSSEPELNQRKQDALARARVFASTFTTPFWRGFEMAGSNDGRTFMGMFIVFRANW